MQADVPDRREGDNPPSYFLSSNSFLIRGLILLRSISAMILSNSSRGAAGTSAGGLEFSKCSNSFAAISSDFISLFLFHILSQKFKLSPPWKLYNGYSGNVGKKENLSKDMAVKGQKSAFELKFEWMGGISAGKLAGWEVSSYKREEPARGGSCRLYEKKFYLKGYWPLYIY